MCSPPWEIFRCNVERASYLVVFKSKMALSSNYENVKIRVAQLLEEASQLFRQESFSSTSSTSILIQPSIVLQQSSSSGVFNRFNRNERLRAAAPYNNKNNSRNIRSTSRRSSATNKRNTAKTKNLSSLPCFHQKMTKKLS